MIKGLGEVNFSDLIPWLLETLHSSSNTVDRSGGAQGLSEVLAALGTERLATLMPDFLAGTAVTQPHVREGHFLLFIYLPVSFQESFQPFVGAIIPCILRGLADVEETVRTPALIPSYSGSNTLVPRL